MTPLPIPFGLPWAGLCSHQWEVAQLRPGSGSLPVLHGIAHVGRPVPTTSWWEGAVTISGVLGTGQGCPASSSFSSEGAASSIAPADSPLGIKGTPW